jgi:protein translocase SecG subunit
MLANVSPTVIWILGTIFMVNCIAMIVFVLFRQTDTGGVGAAFGGGDGGGAFGTKGQSMVDKVLMFMGGTFIVLSLIFNLVSTQDRAIDMEGIDQTTTQSPTDGGE